MAVKGDKRILMISFLASLTVSLVICPIDTCGGQLCCGNEGNISTAGKGANAVPPSPAGTPDGTGGQREGNGSGNQQMHQPPSPELLALYKKRVALYEKNAEGIAQQFKAASIDEMEVVKAVVARDEAKLALWRCEANMCQTPGAAEAFIRFKAAEEFLHLTEPQYKSGAIPLEELNKVNANFINAKIQLEEAATRIRDKEAWKKAVKSLEAYPKKVTDELLRSLLALEQPPNPR